jgi:lysyl-tRNA synthetase class 2
MLDVPAPRVLRLRAAITRAIRGWLWERGFLEVEAPTLVQSPALEEHLEALQVGDRWLHTSPEFALKRVLAAGLPRVFSLGPCYRGEEYGPLHTTEFTMLEWYRVGCGYRGIMEDLEGILGAAAAAAGVEAPALEHMTVAEAYLRYAGGPPDPDPVEAMRAWINDVEPRLEAPVIVRDYPADQAAFAAVRGAVAERFELYWGGVELANAFTELLDPEELRARWAANNRARERAGRAPHPVDERLVEAVGRHPTCGGIALGVDRLVLVLLGLGDIREARVGG